MQTYVNEGVSSDSRPSEIAESPKEEHDHRRHPHQQPDMDRRPLSDRNHERNDWPGAEDQGK